MPDIYLDKAARALIEAKALSAADYTEGACSRAYYAMFSAARAALLIAGLPATVAKTHDGLINAFGQYIIMSGHIDKKFGRSLNDLHHLRMVADYIGDPPSAKDAAWAIEEAEAFLAAVQTAFGKDKSA